MKAKVRFKWGDKNQCEGFHRQQMRMRSRMQRRETAELETVDRLRLGRRTKDDDGYCRDSVKNLKDDNVAIDGQHQDCAGEDRLGCKPEVIPR